MDRVPVSAETCTVLGYKVKTRDPEWAGLDLDRADLLQQSTLMLAICGPNDAPPDLHLSVPWCHPDDRARGEEPDGCYYRVRPRMEPGKKWAGKKVKAVAFERWAGKWFLAIEYVPPTDTTPVSLPARHTPAPDEPL